MFNGVLKFCNNVSIIAYYSGSIWKIQNGKKMKNELVWWKRKDKVYSKTSFFSSIAKWISFPVCK